MLTVRIETLFEYVDHFLGRHPRLQHVAACVEDLAIVAFPFQLLGHRGVQNARRVAQAAHIRTLERDGPEKSVPCRFD